MAMRRNDRLVESQQAFLVWLDMVEERFCKDLAKKRMQDQETEHWYEGTPVVRNKILNTN